MDSNEISKLIYAVSILKNQPELVDEIVSFQESLNSKIDDLVKKKKGLVCKKGCDYCCYGWEVKATIPELFVMVKYLNQLPEKTRQNLHTELKDYLNQPEDLWKKCPFLQDHLCTIYNGRPFVCRTYSSYDENICKEKREFTFPEFVEDAVKLVEKEEEKITEELRPLFQARTSIRNIQFDPIDGMFFINLFDIITVKPR